MATKAELAAQLAGDSNSLYYRQMLRYRKSELESRVARRAEIRNRPKTTDHEVGEVHRFDGQADIYGGQYRLVEFSTVTGQWTAEYVAPDAETYARILADAEKGSHYIHARSGYETDSFTQAEAELKEREDRAGQRFQVTFVSAERYASYF